MPKRTRLISSSSTNTLRHTARCVISCIRWSSMSAPDPTTAAAAETETLSRLYRGLLRIRRAEEGILELLLKNKLSSTMCHVSIGQEAVAVGVCDACLLYTSPSPRDRQKYRMPSSA